MAQGTVRHIIDEHLSRPASYLTIRKGDRVYDLYGWAAGLVAEPRIAATRDELFDGLMVDFHGGRVFVDAPEIRAIFEGVVVLAVTVADLTRTASDPTGPRCWPGGPRQAAPRRASTSAAHADAVALIAAISRMYMSDGVSLQTLERDVGRVLAAGTGADLDAIAEELLPIPAGD